MLLGDLIASFDEQKATETLFTLGDLAMVTRVQAAARREGMSEGEFARMALQHYASGASDEEWVTVLGQMGRSPEASAPEPGLILLRRALLWALEAHPEPGPENG